jgi:ABC-type Fe3+/spermidine/putrescine transport system ATPase subunit
LRADTLELLKSIQQRLGTTFLFITHDREEALRIGHRIGVLNGGRLEQLGSPEEVYQQPRTAFVASFLGRINWLRGEVVHQGSAPTLVVAGQPLAWANGNGMPNGAVRIGVRPEQVRVSDDGVSDDGWLTGTVVGRDFLGDSLIVRLALADGTVLLADQREPASGITIGQQVRCTWPADATYVFPDEDDSP